MESPEIRFVAIFGGGIDPDDASKGTDLYILDIETGKVIYKRALSGAAPSQPAAVDTNLDGIIDTIYIGTAGAGGGFMYKVNLFEAAVLNTSTGLIDDLDEWKPFKIFDTGGRDLFFPPTVVFDANSGGYALAFGSGDREDMWSEALAGEEGRFYMILDTGFVDIVETPPDGLRDGGVLTEADFLSTKAASANAGTDEVVGTVPLFACPSSECIRSEDSNNLRLRTVLRLAGSSSVAVREKRYLPDGALCPLGRARRERAWPTLTSAGERTTEMR